MTYWKIRGLNKLLKKIGDTDSNIEHFVYQSSNEIDGYRLVSIVLIALLLHKILNACQN